MHYFLEYTFASSGDSLLLKPFKADDERHVPLFRKSLCCFFCDQGTVGEDVKHRFIVALRQGDQVVHSYQRFAAGDHKETYSHCFGFGHHPVQGFIVHVQGPVVFGGPASRAPQVASPGRVDEDCPWNMDPVFCFALLASYRTKQAGVDEHVDPKLLHHIGCKLAQRLDSQPSPVVAFVCEHVSPLLGISFVLGHPGKPFAPSCQVYQVLLRVVPEIPEPLLKGCLTDHRLSQFKRHPPGSPSCSCCNPKKPKNITQDIQVTEVRCESVCKNIPKGRPVAASFYSSIYGLALTD